MLRACYLQNGYCVLQEASLGGHLDLVRMLIEEYKCTLNFIFCARPQPTFGRTLDWLPDALKGHTRESWRSETREYFYQQLGKDNAMIMYLEQIVAKTCYRRPLVSGGFVFVGEPHLYCSYPVVQKVTQQCCQGVQPSLRAIDKTVLPIE